MIKQLKNLLSSLGLSQRQPVAGEPNLPANGFVRHLNQQLRQSIDVLVIAPGVAAIAITLSFTGAFQFLEWTAFDQFFRMRPLEDTDSQVVVITIDETDITEVGTWPFSDAILTQLLEKIKLQQPSVIGLDLYRDLPVEPGHQQWVNMMETTPNLIGVEKVVGKAVKPPPTLSELGQVSFADVMVDSDGKVRRGLLSMRTDSGEIQLGLATTLALHHLGIQGITLQALDEKGQQYQLGKATFSSLAAYEGGYVQTDTGGYQVLLNYRGPAERFQTVSLSDMLNDRVDPNLLRDRIVFIGTVAESLKDPFQSPYNGTHATVYSFTPGVFIHANLTSQIVNAALDGRPLLRGMKPPYSWIWVALWSLIGVLVTRQLLTTDRADKARFSFQTVFGVSLTGGLLLLSSFGAFWGGWWIPVVPALLATVMGAAGCTLRQYAQFLRLSSVDGLTQLANRRFFDQYLAQRILERQPLSLLICDVDFFKLFNDEYGHQAGDHCLQDVAKAISRAIREGDLAARYGGEEFVVVLPNTDATVAIQIADRVRAAVSSLQIPHCRSEAEAHVTMSGGLAIIETGPHVSCQDLIEHADQALYQAKREGRNRIIKKVLVPPKLGYKVY